MHRILLISVSLLALGACGSSTTDGGSTDGGSTGGGSTGGGSGIGSDNQPFTVTGQAISTQLTSTGFGAFSAPNPLTVNGSADTNGDGPDEVVFITNGTTTTFTEPSDEDVDLNGRVLEAEDSDGTLFVATDVDDDSSFEFTAFGLWTQFPGFDTDPSPNQAVHAGVVGVPVTTLPSGSATYSGNSVGIVETGTDVAVTVSDVTVNTDFSSVTVTSSGTLAEATTDGSPALNRSDLDFTATGSVTGTGYAATGGGMQVNGAFYGPNAEETGGVFSGAPGGAIYGGAFGAAR